MDAHDRKVISQMSDALAGLGVAPRVTFALAREEPRHHETGQLQVKKFLDAALSHDNIFELDAAERQTLVNPVKTLKKVQTWSPTVHRWFPRRERAAITDMLFALRNAGIPNDVVVAHLLPVMFTQPGPWANSRMVADRAAWFASPEFARARLRHM